MERRDEMDAYLTAEHQTMVESHVVARQASEET
jgi:hypothetical protein